MKVVFPTKNYKYFAGDVSNLKLWLRGKASGTVSVHLDDPDGAPLAHAGISLETDAWETVEIPAVFTGVHALYLRYEGQGSFDFLQFAFKIDG